MYDANKKGLRSDKIILVIFCATLGFIITLHAINNNLIQYATLPKLVTFQTIDDSTGKNVFFNLDVKSIFAIDNDSTNKATIAKGKIVNKNILYHENRFFPIWGMLILVMITIASGSAPVFIDQFIRLKKDFNVGIVAVAKALLYTILIAGFLIVSNSSGVGYYKPPDIICDFHILFKNGKILEYIVGSTILLVIPVIAVMFLVGSCSDQLLSGRITKDIAARLTGKFATLNTVLLNSLYVLSAIVVFTVLTSGTLKETIKATVQIEGFDIFPTEISYAYGIFFSLFLCVIYIPISFYLKQQVDYFSNIVSDMDEPVEYKEKILAGIAIKNSPLDNLKTALTVLAPLITSLLPENLHFLQ